MRPLTRRDTIIELIRTLDDVLLDENGSPGDRRDSRVLKHHSLYHEACIDHVCKGGPCHCQPVCERGQRCRSPWREVLRCLNVLRDERPTQYWHFAERHIRCRRHRFDVKVVNGRYQLPSHTAASYDNSFRFKGKTLTVKDVQVETWNPAVRLGKVDRALDFLSHQFRGAPTLPREILDAVAA
jgi:hypothetical protein